MHTTSDELGDASVRILVPKGRRLKVLDVAHSHLLASNVGSKTTLTRLQAKFWWPRMVFDVEDFGRTCSVCKQASIFVWPIAVKAELVCMFQLIGESESVVKVKIKAQIDKGASVKFLEPGVIVLVWNPGIHFKMEVLWDGPYQISKTICDVTKFLGLAGYRKYVSDFASHSCNLFMATRKSAPGKVAWTSTFQSAFLCFKQQFILIFMLMLLVVGVLFLSRLCPDDSSIALPVSSTEEGGGDVMRSPILQSPNMGRLQTVSPDSPDIQTVLINSIDNAN